MSHSADGHTHDVYMIEVMETVDRDRVIELWGTKMDADKSAASWREKKRLVSMTVETIRWS